MRGRHGQFPEYHVRRRPVVRDRSAHAHSLEVLGAIVGVVDGDRRMLNTEPFGEPQLGRRGLYGAVGGQQLPDGQLAMLWVLNLCDGDHSLLDIAERAGLPFETIRATAAMLEAHGLLIEHGG